MDTDRIRCSGVHPDTNQSIELVKTQAPEGTQVRTAFSKSCLHHEAKYNFTQDQLSNLSTNWSRNASPELKNYFKKISRLFFKSLGAIRWDKDSKSTLTQLGLTNTKPDF